MINLLKKNLSSKQKHFLLILLSKVKLLFFLKKIGKNSYIDKTVRVIGWKNIQIGNSSVIGEKSWLNINSRKENFNHIEIGNNCYLGKRTTISSANKIIFKDYCLIGDDCRFIGANHIYSNPMEPYSFSGVSDKEKIIIGVNVWFGTNICVVGDITIGHGSIIGAGSVVTKSIPPFSIAVGNPCRVIKRYDFKQKKWINIAQWEKMSNYIYPEEDVYLDQMLDKQLNVNSFKRAASSKRQNML